METLFYNFLTMIFALEIVVLVIIFILIGIRIFGFLLDLFFKFMDFVLWKFDVFGIVVLDVIIFGFLGWKFCNL